MKVYELLDTPDKWTQREFALTKKGKETTPHSKYAVCWCLEGAIIKCHGRGHSSAWKKVVQAITLRSDQRDFPYEWNDNPARTYDEVIALCHELDI